MSSVQSKSLDLTYSNATTYLTATGDGKVPYTGTAGSSQYAFAVAAYQGTGTIVLNDAAKKKLYPNATAKPTRVTGNYKLHVSANNLNNNYMNFVMNGSTIKEGSGKISKDSPVTYSFDNSSSAVTDYTRDNSDIHYAGRAYIVLGLIMADAVSTANITFYFTRYDFSATADTGVTSASVSSSTGYDGDTVTFSCVIPTGYVFDGWYNGTTLVSSSQSYTHTVNGADLSLTAKAHQDTHSVNGTYNGSTKAILTGVTGDVTVSYNGKTKTLNSSAASHTLSCANKAMHGNVSVGSASLATAEKIMRSDLVLDYV